MKEKRESNKKDGGIYSITYKPGSESTDKRSRNKSNNSDSGYRDAFKPVKSGRKKKRKKKNDW